MTKTIIFMIYVVTLMRSVVALLTVIIGLIRKNRRK